MEGNTVSGNTKEAMRDALSAQAQAEPPRVYLVATGETHEGQETYTRHDDAPPPLCDSECLYTAPPAVKAEPSFTLQQVADACVAAEIPDSKCESLLMELEAAPPAVKAEPLTDEQIGLCSATAFLEFSDYMHSDWNTALTRAVERAHGIGGEQ